MISGGYPAYNQAAPGAAGAAAEAGRGIYDVGGAALNDLFNPKPTLAQTLSQLRGLV